MAIAHYKHTVAERLMRYVQIDTQSDPNATSQPSTLKQLDLSRLLLEELKGLGCSDSSYSCSGAPSWVYATSYWSGYVSGTNYVWYVYSDGEFDYERGGYSNSRNFGCRPVIVISKDYF